MAKRYLSRKGSPKFYAPRQPGEAGWEQWINFALTEGMLQMESIDSHGAYWIAAHLYLETRPGETDRLREALSADPRLLVTQNGAFLHVVAEMDRFVSHGEESHYKDTAVRAYTSTLRLLSGYPDAVASGAWEWEFDA